MEKICLEIDKAILATLPTKGLKAYGLCELVTKGKQIHPVTCKDRKQAEIHDLFDGIFYHRFLNATPAEDVDFSFGIDISDRVSARLRTFVAFKVKLGEEFIFDFIKALPVRMSITGFKLLQRSSNVDLIADHEGVYSQEYGEKTPYEHHRTSWNIYAVEYNIEFILC